MAKKYYFASDFHLGAPNALESALREKRIVAWLDSIKNDVEELFILGDVFDFWFEFKTVVPRGYVRLLGKLAEISDSGVPIHWFIGNHDMWIFDYIPSELKITMHRKPIRKTMLGKTFYIGHGDGLGPGDNGYKFLKKIFRAPALQWVFARFHPNFGIGLANYFSSISRKSGHEKDKVFLGKENEWLAIYSEELDYLQPTDYYIFGHRHLPMMLQLRAGGKYVNLGDWITNFTYGVFDGQEFKLLPYGSTPTIYSNIPVSR